MTVPPPDPAHPPGIRLSDADRERAATRLHEALAEGRITVTELEERLSTVYAARYEGDLRPPLADLPGGQPAAQEPVAVPSGEPVVLRAGMSTLKRSGEFPSLVTHMIAVGERSGQLEQMLVDVANAYDREVNIALTRMTATLEPLMIVLMGGSVGFIVFSIMQPIMLLNEMAGQQ